MAALYVVATPIGNLEDMTRRGERVLREVAHIAAEDTRRTGLLLQHLGIQSSLISLHGHNEASRIAQVVKWLEDGEDVALVTDAGTPLVSDPGSRLVEAVAQAGLTVVPVPGPSAVLTALAGCGLPVEHFAFLGFLPRKGKDRATALARIAESGETCVFFESPERTGRTLADLEEVCGGERHAVVARELTKLHEEFRRGTAAELAAYYSTEKPRGEVTIVVDAAPAGGAPDAAAVRDRARELLDAGGRPSGVARDLARELGISRNDAYAVVQELKEESP